MSKTHKQRSNSLIGLDLGLEPMPELDALTPVTSRQSHVTHRTTNKLGSLMCFPIPTMVRGMGKSCLGVLS
jgi:hypothetical protein